MTNKDIIMNESIKLMENGIIKGTGKIITIQYDNGAKQVEMPEEIHTFQKWKELGYCVKKGEKAKAKFPIWKHVSKKLNEDTGNEELDKMNKSINVQGGHESMFMKMSAFFTFDQVEAI